MAHPISTVLWLKSATGEELVGQTTCVPHHLWNSCALSIKPEDTVNLEFLNWSYFVTPSLRNQKETWQPEFDASCLRVLHAEYRCRAW